jgi:hypothetical protein
MRLGLIVLVLLLATAALLFGPSLFQGGGDVDSPDGTTDGVKGPGPELQAPAPPPKEGDSPTEEPEPEMLRLERPLKVLMLMTRKTQRWARTMEVALRSDRQIEVSGYALEDTPGVPDFGHGAVPPAGARPGAEWFDAQGFDVLVLSDVDPAEFEPALWASVASRVRAGSLGLWAQPGVPLPRALGEKAAEVHGLLAEPTLAALLPVERATPIRGQPLPGVFAREAPFALTAEGEKHVASRMVFWPEWSRRIWQVGAASTPPWGTQFCYPVEALKPGSVVLVEVRPPTGKALPMYVQGAPASGRVLWFGAQQVADDTCAAANRRQVVRPDSRDCLAGGPRPVGAALAALRCRGRPGGPPV